ncbi:MAG: hypothetical protein V4549_18190 [Bacteroidota bacterium]
MNIDVIACGESALKYAYTGNITVGVNDCYKIHPVDYLVCVDLPRAFEKERLRQILNSRPIKFYTQLSDWKALMKTYEHIDFANGSGVLKRFGKDNTICYSNNSAFVACVIAYKLGAKQINLYGADFNTHPNFIDNNLKKTLKDFKALDNLLSLNGCKLMVTKESRLSEIIQSI